MHLSSLATAPDFLSLAADFESRELRKTLQQAINLLLSEKCGDIIKRKYGFPPYQDQEQSVIAISEIYGVTRGSIYQLEQAALKKLHHHLQSKHV